MDAEKIKRVLDACYLAKRIRDLLPPLPGGVMPSYIRYLDVIRKLEEKNGNVRISDISSAMNLPLPGVTRTIKEMTEKGYLEKAASKQDGRVTYVSITETGAALSERFDQRFFDVLSKELSDVSDSEADAMIRTTERLYDVMCRRGKSNESIQE
jgi:MarR family transcriptional regulator, organic hydroperoxide resistance regulator